MQSATRDRGATALSPSQKPHGNRTRPTYPLPSKTRLGDKSGPRVFAAGAPERTKPKKEAALPPATIAPDGRRHPAPAPPGPRRDLGAALVRGSEPFASLAAPVSISMDFESDFCKILIEICDTKSSEFDKRFQMLKPRKPHADPTFSRLASQFPAPLIPPRRNRLSPFSRPSGALPQNPASEHLSPLASTCAAPPLLLTFGPLPLGGRPGQAKRDPGSIGTLSSREMKARSPRAPVIPDGLRRSRMA